MKELDESVWMDIHKQSTGDIERREDDVNLMDFDTFAEYIKDAYSEKSDWFAIRESEDGKSRHIEIDIISGIDLSFNEVNGKIYNILVQSSNKYVDVPGLKKVFNVNVLGSSTYSVLEKDWKKSNNTFVKLIEFFLDKKTNESVWMDIHKQSAGDTERKEDELTDEEKICLRETAKMFRNVCAGKERGFEISGSKSVRYYDNKCEGFVKYINKRKLEHFWNGIEDETYDRMINYVRRTWTNNQTIYQYYKEQFENMNESSVWVDIHKHSAGDTERKEDEIPQEALEKLDQCYYYYAYSIVSEDKPETLDGFCDYLEDELKNYPFRDSILQYIKDYWADEIADTLDGWVDQARIDYDKDMNECEGVPGGLTPVDVGGMGPAYFPGPNGESGSGDLPSPTGKVYQQVAPFGIFVNSLYGKKKKKRKKKFRKEDEPCVHSPNAKVYDYVDDYREYVDRTYDNMDRRK